MRVGREGMAAPGITGMMKFYSYRNRRRVHRVYLRTDVSCRDPFGRSHEGLIGNLGEGGVFVHAPAPFPIGSRIRIALRLDHPDAPHPIVASGVVTWVRRHGADRVPGYGVRFTEMDEAHRDWLRERLDQQREASLRLWSN